MVAVINVALNKNSKINLNFLNLIINLSISEKKYNN